MCLCLLAARTSVNLGAQQPHGVDAMFKFFFKSEDGFLFVADANFLFEQIWHDSFVLFLHNVVHSLSLWSKMLPPVFKENE